jgi:hypothetical protein
MDGEAVRAAVPFLVSALRADPPDSETSPEARGHWNHEISAVMRLVKAFAPHVEEVPPVAEAVEGLLAKLLPAFEDEGAGALAALAIREVGGFLLTCIHLHLLYA